MLPPHVSWRKYLRRAHAILLPTVVVGGMYGLLNDIPLTDMLHDKYKSGYWFTITLFEYYVIADVLRLMAFKRQRAFYGLIVVTGIVCYAFGMPTVQRLYGDVALAHIIGVEQWKYFLFFALGMFVRRFANEVQSDKGGAVVIVGFSAVYAVNAICGLQLHGVFYNLNLLLQETTIVLLAYYLFYRHQAFFSSQTATGRLLQQIGTSTLEIYLLHYFVLPRHLDALAESLDLLENPFVALFSCLSITAGVVAVVCVVKSVLQCNPYVRRILWNK